MHIVVVVIIVEVEVVVIVAAAPLILILPVNQTNIGTLISILMFSFLYLHQQTENNAR